MKLHEIKAQIQELRRTLTNNTPQLEADRRREMENELANLNRRLDKVKLACESFRKPS